jgi:hypothetical protein
MPKERLSPAWTWRTTWPRSVIDRTQSDTVVSGAESCRAISVRVIPGVARSWL